MRHVAYIAVPKLADERAFYLLDPASLTLPPAEAATMRAAADHAPRLAVEELRPIDLVVCGSVAVNHHGDRIGKGAGYPDLRSRPPPPRHPRATHGHRHDCPLTRGA
jgi:5-formyltetrahydrofolate cyclo-ligase